MDCILEPTLDTRMKALKKLLKPGWKYEDFDPGKQINDKNKLTPDPVEEYDSALKEIELRDR